MKTISTRKKYRFLRVGEIIEKTDFSLKVSMAFDASWEKSDFVGNKVPSFGVGCFIREVK